MTRGPMHSESELLDRLVNVLTYAADGLARLEKHASHWTEDSRAFLRRQDKVAAEAILLAYLASRLPRKPPRLEQTIEAVRDQALAHIATERNEALLRRFPQTATTLGVGFVLLAQLGRSQPSRERLLRSALGRGFATLAERSTFRMMDTRWTFGLLDPGLVRPVEELVPLSTLGASPHPIYTMKEDDYALTHAVYYLTDFGRHAPPSSLRLESRRLADPFLAWHAIRLDLDLLGEFLIAGLALREPASPAFRFAWHTFFEAWERDEGLVGPEFSPARFAELRGEEAAAYAFWENYHTVFVGGILCVVALLAPRPGVSIADPRPATDAALVSRCAGAAASARAWLGRKRATARPETSCPSADDLPEWAISRLLALLPSPGSTPLWLRVAMDCDLSRPEIAAVLHEALLVAAAKEYRLAQLAEALAVGAEHADLRSVTFGRALEFLLDQQLADGSVGIHQLLGGQGDASVLVEAQRTIAALLARIASALDG
jgi:hypothetical protein